MRFHVAISRYGGLSLPHAELLRGLRQLGVPIVEMLGCAYEEMALAEFLREALERADETDAVVLLDPLAWGNPAAPAALAAKALTGDRIVTTPCATAVPVTVIRRMAERMAREGTEYVKTPFSAALETEPREPFRPLFCPWGPDGLSLVPTFRLPPISAFLHRAHAGGERIETGAVNLQAPCRPASWTVANATSAPRHHYAITLATFGALDHAQQSGLRELEKHGVPIYQLHDHPHIDAARDLLLARALADGFAGVFMLDHDIHFVPADVLSVVAEAESRQALVGVPYCMRERGNQVIGAFEASPGTDLQFFEGGQLYPSSYTGMGFTAIPRAIAEQAIEARGSPPLGAGLEAAPVFSLMIQRGYYAGEDVSFCARVHDIASTELPSGEWQMRTTWRGQSPSGRVWLDTRPRIFHVGSYAYGIEDAGIVVPRIQSLKTRLAATKADARAAVLFADGLRAETRDAALGLAPDQAGTPAEHPKFREAHP